MRLDEKRLRKIIRGLVLEKFKSKLPQPPPAFNKLPGYAKNKEMNIYDALYGTENSGLRDEIFKPIDDSYRKALGQQNADIQSPNDLMNPGKNDYVDFLAWDIDQDPHPDVIRGMKPKSGYTKLSLSATDGTELAADYSKADTIARLMDGSHWAEMSGPASAIAMKAGVPAITDEAAAMALVAKKGVIWFGEHPYFTGDPAYADLVREANYSKNAALKINKGANPELYDGWYVRMLGNPPKPHAKMVFGNIK